MDKLCKTRYLDNLEFAQWFKRFAQQRQPDKDYDPVKRRGGVAVDLSFAQKVVVPKIFNQ